ncbi:MAG: helix-turn-helix transcriptional regulator [Candidatus Acidiferrum sp.]
MEAKRTARIIGELDCSELPDFRVRLIEYPKGMWQPTHTHEQGSVTLVLSGVIEEERHSRIHVAMPFSLIVKRPGMPHSDRFGPKGCKTLQISLPFEFELAECDVKTDSVIWHNDGGTSIAPMLDILRRIRMGSGLSSSDVAFCIYEALDALPATSRNSPAPVWLGRVREMIDSADPLRPIPLARLHESVRIHPVHLTRQFKRHFGCTIREYMQYRRIRTAASLVAEGSMSLTEVAHQCAFADQAHFCRAFRSVAKLTARDYRTLTKSLGHLNVANVQLSSPSKTSFSS